MALYSSSLLIYLTIQSSFKLNNYLDAISLYLIVFFLVTFALSNHNTDISLPKAPATAVSPYKTSSYTITGASLWAHWLRPMWEGLVQEAVIGWTSTCKPMAQIWPTFWSVFSYCKLLVGLGSILKPLGVNSGLCCFAL